MDNYTKIYWLTRLDSVQALCIGALIVCMIGLFVWFGILWIECYDSDERAEFTSKSKGYRNWFVSIAIITSVILTFLPSKNDMILIYAGGKTMDFAESDTSLSKIPHQTTAIISDYLDKQIRELKEKQE